MKKLILRNFETNQLVDRGGKNFTAVSLNRDQTGSRIKKYQVKYFDEI